MSNYKNGDIVVMNTDNFGAFYVNEQLTYLRSAGDEHHSILKNIHGSEIFVPTDSFDLRDKPNFEIGEVIEASNHEDFKVVDKVYFVADASQIKPLDEDYSIITASDMGTIQNYKYARKIVEKTYTIKHDSVEYNVSREIKEKVDAAIQEAIDYSKNN